MYLLLYTNISQPGSGWLQSAQVGLIRNLRHGTEPIFPPGTNLSPAEIA